MAENQREDVDEMKREYVLVLTLGVFSIINTEMGVIGILPLIAEQYRVDIAAAGMLVSLFALAVAVSGPVLPLVFSGFNRKKVMLLVLGVFCVCNVIAAFAADFRVLVIARVLPAFLHPIYVSLAFTVAAASARPEEAPQAVSKVMIGVSAGMVLGVPIVSAIANAVSLSAAMLFFAFVNGIAWGVTFWLIPSLPVRAKLSYGAQLGVLRRGEVWLSFLAVVFLNGAVFGVFSYLADYLEHVTVLSSSFITGLLLVYGCANILGNLIAGRFLSREPVIFAVSVPLLIGLVYCLLFWFGNHAAPTAVLVFFWGVLAGAGGNVNQYWIASAAPDAPDFANGLFLVATNLGTTFGAALCGALIARIASQAAMYGGVGFLALTVFFFWVRLRLPAGGALGRGASVCDSGKTS